MRYMAKATETSEKEVKTGAKKTATKKSTKAAPKAKAKPSSEEIMDDDEVLMDEAPSERNFSQTLNVEELANSLAQALSGQKNVVMNYSERKEFFGSEITSADKLKNAPDKRAKTRNDWFKDEAAELAHAVGSKRIKWVEINGREESNTYGLCLVARLCNHDPEVDKNRGIFKIMIPVNELFVLSQDDPRFQGPKALKYLDREVDKWIGLQVQVVVLSYNEKEHSAIASRLYASSKLASKFFRPTIGYETAEYKKGDVLTGTVMSRKRDEITVSVYGQDIRIGTRESSWLPTRPLQKEFKRGEKVNVMITELNPDFEWEVNGHKYHLCKMEGSIRLASENPNEIYFDDFDLNQKYMGTVKNTSADGKQAFVIIANKAMCVCPTPRFGVIGDRVLVQVTEKVESKHWIYGNIVDPAI